MAEEITFGEMSTGAQGDLEQVTTIARRMIKEWGMSDKLPPRTFGRREELVFLGRAVDEQKDDGEKVADAIDEEIKDLISNARQVAQESLTENRSKLVQIADRLLTQETVEGEKLEALFNEPIASIPPEPVPAPQA